MLLASHSILTMPACQHAAMPDARSSEKNLSFFLFFSKRLPLLVLPPSAAVNDSEATRRSTAALLCPYHNNGSVGCSGFYRGNYDDKSKEQIPDIEAYLVPLTELFACSLAGVNIECLHSTFVWKHLAVNSDLVPVSILVLMLFLKNFKLPVPDAIRDVRLGPSAQQYGLMVRALPACSFFSRLSST
ncbi:hypothetical protein EVAR_6783_1 [Eumeta japonica]|uniref:Uncharacterized protein n=1 Tax=Eumeta variegata TaxID=151549 RepID=A0A4C1V5C8_EUMVA|nr:hypothetical protein EVAR_6783_1 [Eumeta japonica]